VKVVMTGGGSGGHITPILAVAHELKQLEPDTHITYIGQTGDSFAEIVAENTAIDAVKSVRAGKFRRYHGEGLKQLLDVATLGKNLRDALFVLAGLWQSFWLLGRLKPDVIFTRGGFVSVPVALAAALRRIPYITHDSDAIPSLANRLIARWAVLHAVALPVDLYPYPPEKTLNVGVPVSHLFQPVDPVLQQQYKKQLGLQRYKHLLLVTGGGLGAKIINDTLLTIAPELLAADPGLCIVHTVGQKHEASVSAGYTRRLPAAVRKRVIVRDFVSDLYRYSGAADVVVARGGASTFAELAQQGRACIIIPNPILTGGHQTKNAAAYAAAGAVIVVSEKQLADEGRELANEIIYLLQHSERRQALATNLQTFARPDAARMLAERLLQIGRAKKGA
jgi:UDP-N-acetylglucosamine--N-acetylmuramyl-(pentapeptide) pyrophosphoryl-undecaprenol N-acetylglucosamine transferase